MKIGQQFTLPKDKTSWVGNIKVPAGRLMQVTRANSQGIQAIVVPDDRGILDPIGGIPVVIRSWDL